MRTFLLLTAGAAMLAACGSSEPATEPEPAPSAESEPAMPDAPAPEPQTETADPYAEARPISYSDLLERARPEADMRIAYGEGELSYGELWLPEGDGPHPVVAMIHGGCWLASLPGTELMDYINADLRAQGVAVWNIEYRRIGHEGGGWPGTFTDTMAGIDHLREIAPEHDLDLDRLVFSGHSAGGHLALWAAARPKLPEDSPLYSEDPLVPDAVVTLAGINDLAAYRAHGPDACGGPETIDSLVGAETRETEALYADTSPPRLLPIGVDQLIVSGAVDPIVPPQFGEWYVKEAEQAGDRVRGAVYPDSGHFELIDPASPAWTEIRGEILSKLGVTKD